MNDKTLAIVSGREPDGRSEVTWCDPTSAQGAQLLAANVQGFSYAELTDAGEPVLGADSQPVLQRPITRGLRRLGKFKNFLGIDDMRFEGGVFCEITGRTGSQSVSVYAPMQLGERGYRVQARGIDKLPQSVTEFASVNFVTGPCLFSNQALRFIGEDGRAADVLMPMSKPIQAPVHRIESDPKLTLYELEAAGRLPWLVADLATRIPQGIPVTVTLDVPRLQYYFYLLEAFSKQRISSKLLNHWFDLVDGRYEETVAMLEAQLKEAAASAGGRLTLRRATNMAVLEPAIRESVRSGVPLGVDYASKLLADHDPVWQLALEALPAHTYRELFESSYVVELLRAGQKRDDGRPQLCIEADDIGEQRIYVEALKRASSITRAHPDFEATMLGLYPLPRIFTSRHTGRTDLYINDPGRELVDVSSGRKYSPDELLDALYDRKELAADA